MVGGGLAGCTISNHLLETYDDGWLPYMKILNRALLECFHPVGTAAHGKGRRRGSCSQRYLNPPCRLLDSSVFPFILAIARTDNRLRFGRTGCFHHCKRLRHE